jgi:uncharacterized protein YoxC
MIETISEHLPIIIQFLLIILIIVGIVLGIRMICTINKINAVIEDVIEKLEAINDVFKMIGNITNRLSFISNKLITMVFGKQKKDGD